ncbi:MAG: hypothetical protein R2824_10050 [Saprospiraceae bacterium]|nr:hypothetical protein [Lewinella sp.]
MARRDSSFFNLSFLDLLTSALGAIIFLFIITPKGGASAAKVQQLAVYMDTVQHKIFGLMPDSLWKKQVGDTLFTVVVDYKAMPEDKSERVIVLNEPPPRPAEKPVKVSQKEEPKDDPKPEEKPEKKTEETAQPQTPAPAPVTPAPPVYRGDAPSVPCNFSVELAWEDLKDNVDLFLCKGDNCVYGGRKRDRSIGEWDSGKSRNRLFGNDLRTTQEAVRQFDEIIPGEYTIYAHFKESSKNRTSIPVRGLIYTKNAKGEERGENFSKTLPLTEDRVMLGRVTVKVDGSYTFTRK